MSDRPVRPEATPADIEQAAGLIAACDAASLAALGGEGAPCIALTAPALAEDGAPLILASDLSAHGQALRSDGRSSLLYAAAVDGRQPLATARVSLAGLAAPARPADRDAYLARRPEAELYIDFGDMRLYRFAPARCHLVAGFGRAVFLPPDDLMQAAAGLRDIGPQSIGN